MTPARAAKMHEILADYHATENAKHVFSAYHTELEVRLRREAKRLRDKIAADAMLKARFTNPNTEHESDGSN